MLTRKALFFKVCVDISYPKKTSGILTYFSLTAIHLHLCPKRQSFSCCVLLK
ncbi:hypothetical protein MPF81_03690 [Helicobacter pylori]|uniref:hypothetical protein n=1 Tax=Helicobacter pylori TaxID=210 RepID=UPI001FD3E049|nr:hypothetical protein [Helicobacter pylori]UOR37044.1 hypothetical protein MPF81_03690 [Helicobacter pylori]